MAGYKKPRGTATEHINMTYKHINQVLISSTLLKTRQVDADSVANTVAIHFSAKENMMRD